MTSIISMKPAFKSLPIPNPGVYSGRAFRIVDIGTHKGEYKGKETIAEKLLISFELSGPRDPDGKLFVVQSEVTKSLSELSNLFHWAKAMLQRDLTQDELSGNLDLRTLLDKPISLEVVQSTSSSTGRTSAIVNKKSVAKLHPQLTADTLESPTFTLGFPPNAADFAALTQFEKFKIGESVGWSGPTT